MRVYVYHAFCDGQLVDTRLFRQLFMADEARVELLEKTAVEIVDGNEFIDANGATWTVVIEKGAVE